MKVMRKYLILAAVLLASAPVMRAEEFPADSVLTATDTLSLQDSVAERIYMSYDSLMTYLGDAVRMSDCLEKALDSQVEKNRARKVQGYRVRIYFDNSQDARQISEQIVDSFSVRHHGVPVVYHPGVPVFRSYDNPYFKVTVGEFRARSDAMRFLEAIRKEYPTVFLVRESFSTI